MARFLHHLRPQQRFASDPNRISSPVPGLHSPRPISGNTHHSRSPEYSPDAPHLLPHAPPRPIHSRPNLPRRATNQIRAMGNQQIILLHKSSRSPTNNPIHSTSSGNVREKSRGKDALAHCSNSRGRESIMQILNATVDGLKSSHRIRNRR